MSRGYFAILDKNKAMQYAREGGYASSAEFRQHLRDKFRHILQTRGEDAAIMAIWRAGKRSGYYNRGNKRSLTPAEFERLL